MQTWTDNSLLRYGVLLGIRMFFFRKQFLKMSIHDTLTNNFLLKTQTARWNRLQGAKEKYQGVFEIQRSGDKTSSGKIGLDIRTHASPKVGQDQVSGGVSVLCWHAAPVAYVLCFSRKWILGHKSALHIKVSLLQRENIKKVKNTEHRN